MFLPHCINSHSGERNLKINVFSPKKKHMWNLYWNKKINTKWTVMLYPSFNSHVRLDVHPLASDVSLLCWTRHNNENGGYGNLVSTVWSWFCLSQPQKLELEQTWEHSFTGSRPSSEQVPTTECEKFQPLSTGESKWHTLPKTRPVRFASE